MFLWLLCNIFLQYRLLLYVVLNLRPYYQQYPKRVWICFVRKTEICWAPCRSPSSNSEQLPQEQIFIETSHTSMKWPVLSNLTLTESWRRSDSKSRSSLSTPYNCNSSSFASSYRPCTLYVADKFCIASLILGCPSLRICRRRVRTSVPRFSASV